MAAEPPAGAATHLPPAVRPRPLRGWRRSPAGSLQGSPRRAAGFPPVTRARPPERRGAGLTADDVAAHRRARRPPAVEDLAHRRALKQRLSSDRWLEAVRIAATA